MPNKGGEISTKVSMLFCEFPDLFNEFRNLRLLVCYPFVRPFFVLLWSYVDNQNLEVGTERITPEL